MRNAQPTLTFESIAIILVKSIVVEGNQGGLRHRQIEEFGTPIPPCSVESWNLSGNPLGHRCGQAMDCRRDCCTTADSQIPFVCVDPPPAMSPAFANILKCMDGWEDEICQSINRADDDPLEPYVQKDPPKMEIIECIDGGKTDCCTRSSQCKSGCCVARYKQCAPTRKRKLTKSGSKARKSGGSGVNNRIPGPNAEYIIKRSKNKSGSRGGGGQEGEMGIDNRVAGNMVCLPM